MQNKLITIRGSHFLVSIYLSWPIPLERQERTQGIDFMGLCTILDCAAADTANRNSIGRFASPKMGESLQLQTLLLQVSFFGISDLQASDVDINNQDGDESATSGRP